MLFKCKMCGGNLEFEADATVGVCDSCGTKQTLPKIDSERRANLYDRANHFRRNNEFDKASGLYEQILAEDKTDAEAYWSLVLCRYGIEYVEDPATNKRIPTVNRAQYTAVYDDENYKSALQYADRFQKDLYEEEANSINEIQKGILEISQKEDPFDVFICYKETDNNGRRTQDSVLATDLYHQLMKEGYKVFFSRITLEDKIGTAYEPYIFAALNSAKVMVVLGTKAEYFNSVWVKNEWSRYLALVKESDGKKVLIPAYRDMDPYDLPEEFSHLQAQDMSKLGFMQDLVRGIQKIVRKEEKKNAVEKEVVTAGNVNVASLLKRVTLFLEDGSFSDANKYCERVLDQDPENAEAYLGKLMAERRVNKTEELLQCSDPLDKSNNYTKILRFGDNELTSILQKYNALIKERNEQERIKTVYQNAVAGMQAADSETAYLEVAKEFSSIIGYMDSAELEQSCLQAATRCKKEEEERIKREAEERRKQAIEQENKKVNTLYTALNSVNNIQGAEGIRVQLLSCALVVNTDEVNKRVDERINIIKREEEKRIQENEIKRKVRKKKIITISVISTVLTIVAVLFFCLVLPGLVYNNEISNLQKGFTYGKTIDIAKIEKVDSALIAWEDIWFFTSKEKRENAVNIRFDIIPLVNKLGDGGALKKSNINKIISSGCMGNASEMKDDLERILQEYSGRKYTDEYDAEGSFLIHNTGEVTTSDYLGPGDYFLMFGYNGKGLYLRGIGNDTVYLEYDASTDSFGSYKRSK